MALLVETGSGSPTAESYASVSDADTYHAARGNAAWAALSSDSKEVNLRKATEHLEQVYLGMWKGDKNLSTQALSWPRSNVYVDDYLIANNALPAQLVKATCELALKASTGPLIVDEGAQVKSKQVGPIAVTYADGARQQKRYAAVDATLRPLLSGGGAGIRLVRA